MNHVASFVIEVAVAIGVPSAAITAAIVADVGVSGTAEALMQFFDAFLIVATFGTMFGGIGAAACVAALRSWRRRTDRPPWEPVLAFAVGLFAGHLLMAAAGPGEEVVGPRLAFAIVAGSIAATTAFPTARDVRVVAAVAAGTILVAAPVYVILAGTGGPWSTAAVFFLASPVAAAAAVTWLDGRLWDPRRDRP